MGGYLKLEKIKLVLFISGSLLFAVNINSCVQNKIDDKKAKLYIANNYDQYSTIWNEANDSLNNWVVDSLSVIKPFFFGAQFAIDSIMLFNEDSTRMFSVVICSNSEWKDGTMDDITHFAGAKINGKWYFFLMGFTLAIPREFYKYDKYAPLTFDQLSYLAYKEIFARGIKQLPDGRYVTDEAFMERQFFDQEYIDEKYGGKRSGLDSSTLSRVASKYQYKLDPEEIASIKKSIAESKRPYLEPQSWWGKIFKRKIFDE